MLDEVGSERKGKCVNVYEVICLHPFGSQTVVCWLELSRLLSTAQNEDRRDMIKRAMQVLDGHEKALSGSTDKYNIQAINPNIHASVYLASSVSNFSIRSNAWNFYCDLSFVDTFCGKRESQQNEAGISTKTAIDA